MTTSVKINNVGKLYGSFRALSDVSMHIGENEFFTLLGPSGCGKTTLLRCIAGFEPVSEGEILLNDKNIVDLQPDERPVNTVFQHYALFPHLTVLDNVAFGLKMKGLNAAQRRKRAAEMLELVHLSEFGNRFPSQLSGGQQQRVALARALAPSPKVLLLDEPLSALDLKLRQAMRLELQQLQQDTGITFIFVTHDQEEALTMSDRIAVMGKGKLQQIGTPREIYEAPINRFVADFIGETNLVPVDIQGQDKDVARVVLPGGAQICCPAVAGHGQRHVSIRPERLSLCETGGELQLEVDQVIYLGTDLQLLGRLPDGSKLSVRLQNNSAVATPDVGAHVGLKLDAGTARLVSD